MRYSSPYIIYYWSSSNTISISISIWHISISLFFILHTGANMVFRLSSEIVGRRATEKFVRTVPLYELDSVQIVIVNPFPVEASFSMNLSMACKTVTPEMILQQILKGLQYSPSPISHSKWLFNLLRINLFISKLLSLFCFEWRRIYSSVFISTLLPFNYFDLTRVVTTLLFF